MTTTAETVRRAHQQARRWRDLLWQSVLDEMAEREPDLAAAARAAIQAQPARALYGASTWDTVAAWPYLDEQARLDWIWVSRFVQQIWIRGAQAVLEESLHERAG